MDEKQHINLSGDGLRRMDTDALEHIASCSFCADQLAAYVEEHAMLTAPKHMQDSILARSRQLDVLVIASSNRASKKMQLLCYSLKVGFAAAFALGLLLWQPETMQFSLLPPVTLESHESSSRPLYDKAQQITDKINGFSKQLFQSEVTFYDEQEK